MTPQKRENPPCLLGSNCPWLASHSHGNCVSQTSWKHSKGTTISHISCNTHYFPTSHPTWIVTYRVLKEQTEFLQIVFLSNSQIWSIEQMNFCSWNTDIQAEGKQRLGMCWAGSRGWQLGRKFTTDCPDYVERALGSGEKGFLVTWSWASHFLSGPQLPYLEKLLNASGTCRTVVWMNEKHSRAPTVTKVLNKWNIVKTYDLYSQLPEKYR